MQRLTKKDKEVLFKLFIDRDSFNFSIATSEILAIILVLHPRCPLYDIVKVYDLYIGLSI